MAPAPRLPLQWSERGVRSSTACGAPSLYRVPLRVLNAIRAFIGEGQCDKGRVWEISDAFEWRRGWGDFVPHLEPGQAAYVEVGLEPGEAA
jgi:hypothetical protein